MTFVNDDLLVYIPDLKKYVKTKVKTNEWEDVVQDTLAYLFIKLDTITISNLLGLVINTSDFFIKEYYKKVNKLIYIENYDNCNLYVEPKYKIFVSGYDSALISDKLYKNINSVPDALYIPFQMQLNDISIHEIASELGLNENTVKTRIRRCKEYLRS